MIAILAGWLLFPVLAVTLVFAMLTESGRWLLERLAKISGMRVW